MADLFSYPPAEARRNGRNIARENRQFASRWTVLRFPSEIPEAERNVVLEPCGHCAAEWYGEVAAQVMAEGTPKKVTEESVRRTAAPAQNRNGGGQFEKLQQLMQWRRENLLSDVEFMKAKQQLGL